MCLGAAIECNIDRIVYGMSAYDGGVSFISEVEGIKERLPTITSGIMEQEQYQLMKKFLATHNTTSPVWCYANHLVDQYETKT